MSPLDEFVELWNASAMPIPFVEVINSRVDLDAVPEQWGSAMLQSDQRVDVTLGSSPWIEESGSIIVGLFARSGTGRSLLDDAIARLRLEFHGHITPTLQFVSVDGPEEIEPEGDGEWWRLAMTIPYRMQARRGAP